jgi:hypothetical protein
MLTLEWMWFSLRAMLSDRFTDLKVLLRQNSVQLARDLA